MTNTMTLGTRLDEGDLVDFTIPHALATHSNGVLGTKGSGKSNAAVVMAEEFYAAGIPWVCLDAKGDWHGIRYSADPDKPGLPVPVFGGLHGNYPLEHTWGAAMAELVVDLNLTCVIDVSEFDTKADMLRFLLDFGRRLFRLHGKHRSVRHVFLEECDEYMPQKIMEGKEVAAQCLSVYQRIVKQGRQRGLGSTMISQRSAVINKDALTQIETLVALAMSAKLDRDAIKGWVDYHGVAPEVVKSLPELEPGEAWIISPRALKLFARVQFRQRWTLDTGATPDFDADEMPLGTMADIDEADILSRMGDAIERVKSMDPAELNRRVADLEHSLQTTTTELDLTRAALDSALQQEPAVVAEPVDRPVLDMDLVAQLESALLPAEEVFVRVEALLGDLGDMVAAHNGWLRGSVAEVPALHKPLPAAPVAVPPPAAAPAAPRPRPQPAGAGPGDTSLGRAERAVLGVLAAFSPKTLSRAEIGIFALYVPSSRHLANILGALRAAGHTTGENTALAITQSGIDALGEYEPPPLGADLLEAWCEKNDVAASAMLRVLFHAWPKTMPKAEIAVGCGKYVKDRPEGYEPTSRHVSNVIGSLGKQGLVTGDNSARAIAPAFHQRP